MDIDVSAAVRRYYAVKDTLSPIKQERAEFFRGQAISYIWGRLDMGDVIDSATGDAFSWAFGTVVALWEAEKITSHGSIQDSWRSFREHGVIRDYNGRAVDRIELTTKTEA